MFISLRHWATVMANFTETLKQNMEVHNDLIFPAFTIFIVSILLILRLMKISKSRPSTNLPPQPWALPLIGNIHQLASSAPHRVMRDLAKKYGPLMRLQLGEVSAMVVSSADVAKEVMKTHDIVFASRPQIIVTNITSYNSKNIAMAPYGDYWRQLRKISTLEVLSAKRVLSFEPIRAEEMGKLINFISSSAGKAIDISEKSSLMMHEIMTRALFGKCMKDETQLIFLSILSKLVKLASGFCIEDLYPSYPFLHVFSRVKPQLEAYRDVLDKTLDSIIHDPEMNQSLLHALKKWQDDPESQITSDHIKAVLMDILAGGSETSTTVVGWAMAELMRSPKVLKKVQAEVRQIFDQQGAVDESRLQDLKYLNLVIKEVFRLHPPLPLLLPRVNSEACIISGYDVPANTKIMINAWAIGRDPKYWEDPDEFRPERFINRSVHFNGNDFEYIPFGSGRRICPGITFGLTTVEYFLANMLFHFDWKLPNGMQPNEIDMTESFGATMEIKKHLLLVPVPYEGSSLAK